MTEANKILELIENVDPQDTAELHDNLDKLWWLIMEHCPDNYDLLLTMGGLVGEIRQDLKKLEDLTDTAALIEKVEGMKGATSTYPHSQDDWAEYGHDNALNAVIKELKGEVHD